MLTQARKKYRFVPNLLGIMAHSPALLKADVAVSSLFDETSLTPLDAPFAPAVWLTQAPAVGRRSR